MRLLVIEDSPRLGALLEAGFRRAGFAVDLVADGPNGLVFAKRGLYDVVILDLMLPGLDGLDLLRELRASGHDTHVLILTARTLVEDRVRGLQTGADDYLQKPFDFDELLARVQALVRRKYGSRDRSLRIGDLSIDTVARRVVCAGVELALTRREYQVLEYLARRQTEVVSRTEIEDHVYGEANLPESNAIESTVCTIRRKLRAVNAAAADLIETVHGIGYRLES